MERRQNLASWNCGRESAIKKMKNVIENNFSGEEVMVTGERSGNDNSNRPFRPFRERCGP